jgi:hypothetical protein
MRELTDSQPEGNLFAQLAADAPKSCRLYRLIYGEPLRTRRCHFHMGRWSGCSTEPCPVEGNATASSSMTSGRRPTDDVEQCHLLERGRSRRHA